MSYTGLNPGHLRAKEVFSLPEGDITMEWPIPMSQESFKDFCEWMNLVQRKMSRLYIKPEVK